METGKMKLALSAGALALSMALAGCGGGGSSTVNAPRGNTETPPPDMKESDPTPTNITSRVPTTDNEYLTGTALPDTAATAIPAAGLTVGWYTFTCSGGDCSITVANGVVTATGDGTVAVDYSQASKDEIAPKKAMAEREKGVQAAGQAAALSNGGTGDGAVIHTRVTHNAGSGVSASADDFVKADEQPSALGAFTGVALVNTQDSSVIEHMVVYTDRAAPTRREFFNFDEDPDTPSLYAANSALDGVLTGGTNNDAPGIQLHDTAAEVTGNTFARFNGANIDSSIFPQKSESRTGGVQRKTFESNSKADGSEITPDGPANVFRQAGTFDGARGEYICNPGDNAVGCVVTVNASGTYSFGSTDAWYFIPNRGVTGWNEDAEYLAFGWWTSEPTGSTGTYQFNAFHSGTPYADATGASGDPAYTGDGMAVTGTATYTGNAAGRYVVSNEAGAFTATAMLEANFGNATTVGSISGSISGFMADGVSKPSWGVTLEEITMTDLTPGDAGLGEAFDTGTDTDISEDDYAGTTADIDGVMAYGSWEGRFYGNARNPRSEGFGRTQDAAPLAVGGEFYADGDNVNIAGAFGARQVTE